MQTLTDEQREAVTRLLDLFPLGCGLDRLDVDELLALGGYVAAVAAESERQGYSSGYSAALVDAKEWQDAIAESQTARAH